LGKFKIYLVIWAIAVVCGIGGVFYYKQHQADKYAATAVPYIKQVVPQISGWDPVVIRSLMSEDSLRNLPPGKFERIIEIFSQMGELQSMDEPVYKQSDSIPLPDGGSRPLVRYEVKARYQKGEAVLTLNLVEMGGGFKVSHFNLGSEVLSSQ